jgi:hypothetical protein
MKNFFIAASFVLFAFSSGIAKTWQVGPGRVYAIPSLVSGIVKDGDTVAIDSGLYTQDVVHWTANNLVLMGVKGMARLNGNGTTFGGKAIWVISGNNVSVRFIEFYNASCVDHNGAGIRAEGANLTLKNCYFHDNEDGILAGDNAGSDILIEYCYFRHNGYGDGLSHNLYINHIHKLTFQFNISMEAKVGHELKSRALNNYILYNKFLDLATGTASRSIDLPNGGFSVVLGNVMEKGPNAQNNNFMEYGLEGLSNPDSELYVMNNTFVNDKTNGLFIQVQNGTKLLKAYNNLFAGPGTLISGAADSIDTTHNFSGQIQDFNFLFPSKYFYHSYYNIGINNAVNPGNARGFDLTPASEYFDNFYNMNFRYVDSLTYYPRNFTKHPDCGAFERVMGSISPEENASLTFTLYPNPALDNFKIKFDKSCRDINLEITDIAGKIIYKKYFPGNVEDLSISQHFAKGTYFLKISGTGATGCRKLIITD